MCSLAGLSVVGIWGGTAGNWGRRELGLDEKARAIVNEVTREIGSPDEMGKKVP